MTLVKKATLLHLRIPFSFFLLPVFLFAAAVADGYNMGVLGLVFFILHFLLYPASNGYNSYFDKDQSSIGGLKNPPAVDRELYDVSLLLDLLALILGCFLSWQLVLMLLVYGLVSKAYSHPSVRLKSMAVVGWLAAGIFQGYFTFIMVSVALLGPDDPDLWTFRLQAAGILSTLLLFGSYPMTQVYQHEEDGRRGDDTLSRKLGVKGTFHFAAFFLVLAALLLAAYFVREYSVHTAGWFLTCLLPVAGYFGYWYWQVSVDQQKADYEHTMWLNLISSTCTNGFFFWLLVR